VAASRARDISGPHAQTRSRVKLNTETSTEPEGITRRVVLNILEAFFRRPWLHLLPLILMLALGAATALGGKEEFRSVGSLTATNESLLADITATNEAGSTFESAAENAAAQMNEFLRTEEFLDIVARGAGLETALEQGQVLRSQLRGAINAFADGDNLVRVSATTNNPELSQRLAQGTIDGYIEQIVGASTEQGQATERVLEGRVNETKQILDEARAELEAFLTTNPNANDEDAPAALAQQFERREADIQRADTRYTAALDALEEAKVTTATAREVVNQRLRPSDPPEVPLAAEPRLRKAALTIILFGALGVMLSLALVVVTATLDRTIRVPNDITARYGLDVLAVVPDMRR
jgi:uncharacterized protein involved in exopolysaccharide biosynthesis